MAGFLARLFEPSVNQLQADIAKLEADAARLRQQLGESDEAYKFWYERCLSLEQQLRAEAKTNRTREDLLVNAALRAHGAEAVPIREVLQNGDKSLEDTQPQLDELTLKILRDRAEEMAGEDATDEQIEQILKKLKLNPEHWATN